MQCKDLVHHVADPIRHSSDKALHCFGLFASFEFPNPILSDRDAHRLGKVSRDIDVTCPPWRGAIEDQRSFRIEQIDRAEDAFRKRTVKTLSAQIGRNVCLSVSVH